MYGKHTGLGLSFVLTRKGSHNHFHSGICHSQLPESVVLHTWLGQPFLILEQDNSNQIQCMILAKDMEGLRMYVT